MLGLLALDSPLDLKRRTADFISPPVTVRRFLRTLEKGGGGEGDTSELRRQVFLEWNAPRADEC